jgi:hypothetical protein
VRMELCEALSTVRGTQEVLCKWIRSKVHLGFGSNHQLLSEANETLGSLLSFHSHSDLTTPVYSKFSLLPAYKALPLLGLVNFKFKLSLALKCST